MTTKRNYYPQTPLPDFAEDTLYPAGSDDWSEGPTKIEPVGAVRDAGVQPDDQMGAQHYNWLNHRYGRLTRALAHAPMNSWEAFTVKQESDGAGPGAYYTNVSTTLGLHALPILYKQGVLGSGEFLPQRPEILAAAMLDDNDTVALATSGYGFHWSDLYSAGGFSATPLKDIICPADNVVVMGFVTPFGKRSTDGGQTFDTVTICETGTSPGQYTQVFHQSASGRLFAGIGGGLAGADRVAVSDDDGATWTRRSIVNEANNIVSLADNGDDVIVAVCRRELDVPVVIRSTDDGETWSEVYNIASLVENETAWVVWSPVWEQFVILHPTIGDASEVLNSSDGASWTVRKGLPSAAGGMPYSTDAPPHGFACVGGVLAVICNLTFASGSYINPGVFYSFDLGTTWTFVALGPHSVGGGPKQMTSIRECGGRFLVGSQGVVYLSGTVWCPDPDITVVTP